MKVRKVIVWSLLNGDLQHDHMKWHPSVREEEIEREQMLKLFWAIFPGAWCPKGDGDPGLYAVARDWVVPVLKKFQPELVGIQADAVAPDEEVEINNFLPGQKYDWLESLAWYANFKAQLAA